MQFSVGGIGDELPPPDMPGARAGCHGRELFEIIPRPTHVYKSAEVLPSLWLAVIAYRNWTLHRSVPHVSLEMQEWSPT